MDSHNLKVALKMDPREIKQRAPNAAVTDGTRTYDGT